MVERLRDAARRVSRLAHGASAILDRPFLSEPATCRWPPVFLMGPPRSGTTLLYQAMIDAFAFSYIPNIANTFYMAPLFATKAGASLCAAHTSDFSSEFGIEPGCMAPSEAGNVWNRWFPTERHDGFNYTPAGYLPSHARNQIYQLVAHFEEMKALPFVNKNVKWSVRLPAVKEIFPEARFIRMRRRQADVALSLLKGRRQRGLGTKWWSVMPKEIDQIRHLSDLEQVVYQVYYVDKTIDNDSDLFGADKVLTIQYTDLCENPKREMQRIQQFLSGAMTLVQSGETALPASFEAAKPSPEGWILPEEAAKVEELLSALQE